MSIQYWKGKGTATIGDKSGNFRIEEFESVYASEFIESEEGNTIPGISAYANSIITKPIILPNTSQGVLNNLLPDSCTPIPLAEYFSDGSLNFYVYYNSCEISIYIKSIILIINITGIYQGLNYASTEICTIDLCNTEESSIQALKNKLTRSSSKNMSLEKTNFNVGNNTSISSKISTKILQQPFQQSPQQLPKQITLPSSKQPPQQPPQLKKKQCCQNKNKK